MLNKISTTTRIALILALASLNSIFVSQLIGVFPDEESVTQENRTYLCESIAIALSGMALKPDTPAMKGYLEAVGERNPKLLAAIVRKNGGEVLTKHTSISNLDLKDERLAAIQIPIVSRNGKWGKVELYFERVIQPGILGTLGRKSVSFCIFLTAFNGIIFIFYLRRVLMHLDPTKAVPDRVRKTLDSVTDGLVILDENSRCVLANKAFLEMVAEKFEKVSGKDISEFAWKAPRGEALPWENLENKNEHGLQLKLDIGTETRTFVTRVSPILADDGSFCGSLVSFNDVTMFEHKRGELLHILKTLKKSREKIEEQNEELRFLATRDPMTKCLNRRSFFELFDKHWERAQKGIEMISCMMVDVDHFKSINDNYGHSMGDEVLKSVSEALLELEEKEHLVCRYGGEEFCVLLIDVDLEVAHQLAEDMCTKISELVFAKFKITASLGISSVEFQADNPEALLDQADAALYAAKRSGRNRVVRWDKISEAKPVEQTERGQLPQNALAKASRIPFQTVASLLAALAYRNPELGAHSVRVADLAVALGKSKMSASKLYILEVAALLHDIGKIGVPDEILKKSPTDLTMEEEQILSFHTQIGVDIVVASFDCEALIDYVLYNAARYEGGPGNPGALKDVEIPLGARIIAIANEYDLLTQGTKHQDAMSSEEALMQLKNEAGKRFDPELVEDFVALASNENFQSQVLTDAHVPRNLATQVSLQTEQLANAIEIRDIDSISELVDQLGMIGEEHQLEQVQALSSEIESVMESEEESLERVEALANELIDFCTKIQTAQVDFASDWSSVIDGE